MQSRKSLLALSILSLAALTSIPARAATPFTTSRFSITYPTGWQTLPIALGDSVLAVFDTANMASSYMTVTTTNHPMTAQEMQAYVAAFGGADSVTKVSDGTKSLGGKSFTYAEYEAVDTSNGPSRYRIYYTSSGTTLFTSILIYDPSQGAGAVTDQESALATLTLTGTPIRVVAARPRAGWSPANHDILGRFSSMTARTALFRVPLR